MSKPSIEALLLLATAKLDQVSATPRLDAEVIMVKLLNSDRIHLVALADQELDPEVVERYFKLIERRKNHEPVAYLIGEKEFWSLNFKVSSDCLIPRPETESMIELALKNIASNQVDILELGTGSGCISISLASELEKKKIDYSIFAVDKSESALDIARQNKTKLLPESKIEFIQSDWFTNVSSKFDLIISNPPYVSLSDSDVYAGAAFEPFSALYSGDSGLADLKKIILESKNFLRKNGVIILEFGSKQKSALEQYLKESELNYKFFNDLSGLPRNVVIKIN